MQSVVWVVLFVLSSCILVLEGSKIKLCSCSPSGDIHLGLEKWVSRTDDTEMTYTNWVDSFTNEWFTTLVNVWNDNRTAPIVSWQPIIGWDSSKAPLDVCSRISNGEYDTYIKDWITHFDQFLRGLDGIWDTADDRSAYMRLGHEMNGNWYPWSPAHDGSSAKPADYVNMWKHVRTMFVDGGLPSSRLPFMFCPNGNDVGQYKMEEFWPGDQYVDMIAVDGYNWGTTKTWSHWQTPQEVFNDMIGRLRKLSSKPLAVAEFGCDRLGGNKSQWIIDTFTYFIQQNVSLICYFNIDMLPDDIATFGGAYGDSTYNYNGKTYNAWAGYKQAVQHLP